MMTKFKLTKIGEIPEGWQRIPLSEYATIVMGQSPSSKYYNEIGEGIEFLQGIRSFGDRYPSFDTYCTNPTKVAEKNDILLSVRAPVGEVNIAPIKLCIGRGLAALSSSNNSFLYYLLKFYSKSFESNSTGTVFSSVSKTDIERVIVDIPNITEQQQIALILSSLDDKIELNRKMNKTLEDMAKALFKYWFVDFEFPNEEAKPYKSSGGEMVESELGPIPKGWETPKFSQLINYLEGPGIRNWQYSTTGTRFINIRLINNGNIDVSSASLINQKDVDEKYQHFLLKENDMVVSTSGTLGKSAIVRKNHLPLLLNTSVIRFRPVSLENYPYMYQYLKSRYFLDEQIRLASGSVQANFGPTHLNQMFVLSPSQIILSMFNNTCKEIYEGILINMDENDILIGIRDSLLPKLMSGRIRVI